MISLSRFKIQMAVVFISSILLSCILMFYSSTDEAEYLEVFTEGGIAFSCLFLMFWVEQLNVKGSRNIYRLLLTSSIFLYLGHLLDAADELTVGIAILDVLEDIFMPVGFLLFIYANFRWVDFHEKQSKHMCRLANLDPLTGLLNRRAFDLKSNLMLHSLYQNNRQVSVIIIDIDHFKQVNDRYGHQCGDQVLVKITTAIKSTLRKNDYICRLGGEEFAVLLYDTNLKESQWVAEKIRVCVEKLNINVGQQEVKCTISLGLAIGYAKEGTLERFIESADKALYRAKAQGRNCLEIANYPINSPGLNNTKG